MVTKIDGSSIRLSLWSQNKNSVEKCLGECFYLIKYIENMEKMMSINEMLTVNKNLRIQNDEEFDRLEVNFIFKPKTNKLLMTKGANQANGI